MIFPFDVIETKIGHASKLHTGQIFSLPSELGGTAKIGRYGDFRIPGKFAIDYGYVALVATGNDGTTYCVPGLLPKTIGFKNRFGVNSALEVDKVEKYLTGYLRENLLDRQRMRDELLLVMHDLRSISATISAMAEEARVANESGKVPQHLLESLVSTQYLLKLRQDSMDFEVEGSQSEGLIETHIFRKVDRVSRAFMTIASKRNIMIRLHGSSFSTSRVPSGFEFVPFILMDNAVKYSPNNTTINVNFSEIGDRIRFDVSSIGPRIEPSECTSIFLAGYRGKAAQDGGHRGNGFGLYTCKRILNRCGGQVSVSVGANDISTTKGLCRDIKFSVEVPLLTKKIS